jgi:glycosyltransferase involved in cell wall biosynthesis
MKVCHLCSAHPADDSRVLHRMCASLSSVGYEVHLFAVSDRIEPYRVKDVIVHPLPECSSRRQRFSRRSRIAEMAENLNPDIFHVHEPELLGSTIARAGSRPVVYDVHESYLDILMERQWVPSPVRPLARLAWDKWERRLTPKCAAIVAATDHIAERYLSLHPRVVSIRNFTDISIQASEIDFANRDGFTCVFAGTILPNRNLDTTIRALGILRRRGTRADLWIAGKWSSDSYKQEIFALAEYEDVGQQVKYFGVLSRAEAVTLQASASIGLVNMLPTPNIVHSLPIRMLEYMAVGLPVIYSDFPSFRDIAGYCGGGIAVDPTSADQTADAIESVIRNPELARQMGQAGMGAVRKQFNWQREQTRLIALYEDILGSVSKSAPKNRSGGRRLNREYITEVKTRSDF